MATVLHAQGATSNSGLGLQSFSSEMETIRHLVSVIQTKLLVFWDSLNKNLKQDRIFLELYEQAWRTTNSALKKMEAYVPEQLFSLWTPQFCQWHVAHTTQELIQVY